MLEEMWYWLIQLIHFTCPSGFYPEEEQRVRKQLQVKLGNVRCFSSNDEMKKSIEITDPNSYLFNLLSRTRKHIFQALVNMAGVHWDLHNPDI